VNVLSQLLLPPAFLHAYGMSLYGQWLALTAAISYLGTFNFGLQTYTNMQMAIHYTRGELQECREVQSGGLRVVLTAILVFAVLLLATFFVPIDSILRLSISQRQAQWTLYILGCQVVVNMLLGLFIGKYLVIGAAHRGTNFQSAIQLLSTLAAAGLALMHASFPIIAGSQIVVTLLATGVLLADLHVAAPDIRPTLRYWRPGALGTVLKPSGQYALLYSSNILAYQAPMMLIQRILGPGAVVVFSVTRTVYSMSRRLLNLVTNSLGPEITMTYSQRDWRKLHRLYELSERIILLLTIPITFGSMLATPLLLQLWLHQGKLYQPMVCLLLGLTVSVLGVKEHKYQFQFSSNQIREISYATVITYGLMIAASFPAMHRFGLPGFLVCWGVTEIVQLCYLLHLNGGLFTEKIDLDRKPVYQLFFLLLLGSAAVVWPLQHIQEVSYPAQGLVAAGVALVTAAASYWMFKVDEVRDVIWRRIAIRFPLLARRG
jgi:O-antigen/teichoic acid export membrane protein